MTKNLILMHLLNLKEICDNIHNSKFQPQRKKKYTKTHSKIRTSKKKNNFLDKDKIQAIHHPNVSVYHKKEEKK